MNSSVGQSHFQIQSVAFRCCLLDRSRIAFPVSAVGGLEVPAPQDGADGWLGQRSGRRICPGGRLAIYADTRRDQPEAFNACETLTTTRSTEGKLPGTPWKQNNPRLDESKRS